MGLGVMKRTYELTVVFPQASVDLTKITKSLENLIGKAEGKVVSREDWGERELAYPIKKQKKGVYFLYLVELSVDKVAQLDKELRLMSELLRYLIVCV
ncbi:MAG: 30S ribosomal protein S6 [Candidatus Chisholmbacteria bacterium RIFCSPLOWO2_01_FULL_50_28]|uniref:Small ribosomal subunit protein bS6 n=1 Tax=Candidatus Chisholmbacteria bacterium RIFCSPHIGHO2_01_FULL_52_32 TaxID=1797591 RepID=A0A1G1VSB4_9BACT|nr:MAG: 30S ribosomal protein S6 [Candidatus Chisholmbacteria bacterium RIFCSPHIGHO2_01_FULL_52_32]OGY20341.1 MAG: 30S ribosomal protein S6 [Candidatus Chisholmbacteria bacterium RIFCSPLOWO2_01_FULL_50_28]